MTDSATPRPPCDLVLRGGATSGVIYPGAVSELARHWRFHAIGGASAGAIAASITAAAEYGRQQPGADDPFVTRIAGMAATMAETDSSGATRLSRLFTPIPALAGAMRVALGVLDGRWLWPLVRLAAPAIAAGAALAAAVAALLTGFADLGLATGHALLFGALVALALTPLSVLAFLPRLVQRLQATLAANGFGLVAGVNPDLGASPSLQQMAENGHLSDWLHAQIQLAAGLPDDEPLTMEHLWKGGPPDPAAAFSPWQRERRITLLLTLSNISQQIGHHFPFMERPGNFLYFHPDDLAPVLPEAVVRWLTRKSMSAYDLAIGSRIYHRLPPARFLPVLLGARLSLSFPGLIAAVRLHETRGWSPRTGRNGVLRNPEDHDAAAAMLRPCWFSDGGITSNFPVSAFDALLPGHPTFCINIASLGRDDLPSRRVILAESNHDQMRARQIAALGSGSLAAFAGAIIDTARNARENELATVPGQRDRIATILLDPQAEGGLNLAMGARTIRCLNLYGRIAARRLSRRFHPATAHLPSAAVMNWQNHRWLRLRATLAAMEGQLTAFDSSYRSPPFHGSSWRGMLSASSSGGRYRWGSKPARDLAVEQAFGLADYAERFTTAQPAGYPSLTIFNGERAKPGSADSLMRRNNAPLPAMRLRLTPASGRDPQQG